MVPSVWGTVSWEPLLPLSRAASLTGSLTRLTRERIHMRLNNQKDAARSCDGARPHFMLHRVWRLGYGLIHLINLILAIPSPTVNFYHHSISFDARRPAVTNSTRASNLPARCVPLFYRLRKGGYLDVQVAVLVLILTISLISRRPLVVSSARAWLLLRRSSA